MCNHIVQCRDKNICLILHFITNSTGLLSGTQPLNGPAGLSSISSAVPGTMSYPLKRAYFTFRQQRLYASSSLTYRL